MLSISDVRPNRVCQGYTRREFLRVGALGCGGLSLSDLLASKASAANTGVPITGKSIVLLFLQGGPPHIEFFDPKMTAPATICSITGEIKTRTPGVTIGGTFPKLAAMTDKFSLVRSYGSKNSGHTYDSVTTGRNEIKAAMGAVYSRAVGTTSSTGMPTNTLILPEAIQTGLKLGSNFETGALPTLTTPGQLGKSYDAFNPAGGGKLKEDMELKVTADRLLDRRGLLSSLDNMRRGIDASGVMDSSTEFQQQAFDVLSGSVAQAFDLSKEDPRVLARYDTTHLFDAKKLQRWGDMRRTTNLLGHQMLLARRLCEAGCGFVTVSDCGWDYHANGNSPKNMAGIWPMGGQVDHAVSAFIEDVAARGLTDDILLIVTGEMGRSPRLNGNGGRDHYGELTSLLISGGGLKMGQVIGESNAYAERPATRPYDPSHLHATVMNTLFDVGQLRVDPGSASDVLNIIAEGSPITELF